MAFRLPTRAVQEALERLDPYQAAVVAHIRNPLLGNLKVSSVAGCGKTFSLVTALGALLILDRIPPADIVATTFTRKAGVELRERLVRIVPSDTADSTSLGTFHSLALRRMRRLEPQKWAMRRCVDVRAEDVPSSSIIWRSIVGWSKEGVPGTREKSLDVGGELSFRNYSTAVDVLRSRGLRYTTKEGKKAANALDLERLHTAWSMHEEAKLALGAWDFADALEGLLDALKDGRIRGKARFILVDEAQDNSKMQLDIARGLVGPEGKLVLIGSGEQAIYTWRGAYPDLFANAETVLKADTLAIPNNYRSGERIVALGNLITKAIPEKWRSKDPANPARAVLGVVEIESGQGEFGEAIEVAEDVATQMAASGPTREYGDFAVLVRTNSAAEAFEGAFMAKGIPCVRQGGRPFWERHDALNFLAYAVLTEIDSWEAFSRIVNRPKRYLGKVYVQSTAVEMDRGLTLLDAAMQAGLSARGQAKGNVRDFVRLIRRWRGETWAQRGDAIFQLLSGALPRDGYNSQPDESRLEALGRARSVGSKFGGAVDLARYADACTKNSLAVAEYAAKNQEKDRGRVVISTVHRAKGLEWPTVYVSIPDGVFPHKRSVGASALQEELRLFYVAVTRAEDRLVVTYPTPEQGYGEGASEFLGFVRELLEE